MKIEQVKALITGGASGLGLAVARHLAAHGAKVALLDINDEAGTAAARIEYDRCSSWGPSTDQRTCPPSQF